jgi:outer membrane protein assembly factor BamB
VQVLPGDRILVAEYHGNRVTERDSTGKVLWEKEIAGPLMAQRLPNGHTFVATDSELVEFDRADKEVFRIQRSGDKIMKALKLPTGEIACLTSDARILRLDTAGKEVHAFSISLGTRLFGGRIHMLPNGRVLVPHNNENKVVEYDAGGKQVWEVSVEQPVAAVRLPNGNTLVTSMLPQRGAVEFDPAGEEKWSYRASTRVTRAVRR